MLIELDTVTSTQQEAKARAQEGCAHGVVVVAAHQSAGRGRRGRTWLSGPHGLWMSMVLRLDLPPSCAPRLPLSACALVAEVLQAAGTAISVKWPNDLMVPSTTTHPTLGPFKKAGGLLIEAVDVDARGLHTAVVGLGLNLTTPALGFGPALEKTAGTLEEGGFDVDGCSRLGLAARLQRALMEVASSTSDDAFAGVCARLALISATLGRRVCIDGDAQVSGMAVGFGDDGALQIMDDAGQLQTVRAGDVMLA